MSRHLQQSLHQFLQCSHQSLVTRKPSLNTGRLCSEVSDLLCLGLGLQAPLIGRSIGSSHPAPQCRVSFGITCLGNTDKRLKEEAPLPPRPNPRVPNPRIREELGIQEAASLPATTRGQITNQGQESSTSLSGPPRPETFCHNHVKHLGSQYLRPRLWRGFRPLRPQQ